LSGTGNVSAAVESVGYFSSGVFRQTGGTNSAGMILVGDAAGGTGLYEQSGGVASVANQLWVGYNATASGTYTISNGTLSAGSIVVGQNGSGTFNLNGGTVTVYAGGITKGTGTAVFNFGGGALKAGNSFSSNVPMTLTGTGGNAKIDTSGYTVSLSGALSGSGGLNKLGDGGLILSGPNTYSGSTTVGAGKLSISADTNLGTPPAGLVVDQLTLNGGALLVTDICALAPTRGLTVSGSGGIEVSSTKTLTLAGPLALSGSATLVKTGLGTLIITGPQNYGLGAVLQFGSSGGSGPDIAGSYSAAPVPEPSALALLSVGAIGLLAYVWRRRKRAG